MSKVQRTSRCGSLSEHFYKAALFSNDTINNEKKKTIWKMRERHIQFIIIKNK